MILSEMAVPFVSNRPLATQPEHHRLVVFWCTTSPQACPDSAVQQTLHSPKRSNCRTPVRAADRKPVREPFHPARHTPTTVQTGHPCRAPFAGTAVISPLDAGRGRLHLPLRTPFSQRQGSFNRCHPTQGPCLGTPDRQRPLASSTPCSPLLAHPRHLPSLERVPENASCHPF